MYAPTTERVKDDPTELDPLYLEPGNTISEIKKDTTCKTSLLLITGDFNAKVGTTKGEPCLGSYSRCIRNTSGQMLVDFCDIHSLFVCNSAFKHPARHITTWKQTRINKDNNQTTKVFNQIDYILCQQSQKSALLNARSYSGTEVNSDHRLVITRMKIAPYHLHRLKKQKVSPPINTPRLQESEAREHYEQVVKEKFDNLQNVQHTNTQQRWDEAVSTIIETAEEVLGLKTTVNNNNNKIDDEEIAKMSQEQKKLRLLISSCHDTEKIQKMRNEGNRLLKKIRKKTTMNRGREIDEKIKEIDELHDESKMFRAVKALNRKKFENPFVHNKDGKNITNPNEIYRTVRNHYKNHFYDENVEKVSPFVGKPKTLRTAITVEEVTRAMKKLSNNRAVSVCPKTFISK